MTLSYEHKLSGVKVKLIKEHIYGKQILDVGAGHCLYSQFIAQHYTGTHVTAIDLYQPNNIQDFSFIQLDLEQPLFFPSNYFDTLLAFDIIEHINNEQQLIDELFRICSSQAILIGSVPHDDDGFLPAYNLTFKHRSDITHKRYYTPASIQESLEKAGFNVLLVQKCGGVSPQVIAEFFPFGLRIPIKKTVGLFRRLGIIKSNLTSDLFFVAKKEQNRAIKQPDNF